MDEIGRGTSTYDGLSLAWACASYIARSLRAFTLFATHYFELTELADEIPSARDVYLDATEHGDGIVFLHAVKPGPASTELRPAGRAAGRRAAHRHRECARVPAGAGAAALLLGQALAGEEQDVTLGRPRRRSILEVLHRSSRSAEVVGVERLAARADPCDDCSCMFRPAGDARPRRHGVDLLGDGHALVTRR